MLVIEWGLRTLLAVPERPPQNPCAQGTGRYGIIGAAATHIACTPVGAHSVRPRDMAATANPRIIVGADSISARGVLRQRKALRANTVRPYTNPQKDRLHLKRRLPMPTRRFFTANQLKAIALVCMLVDHLWATLVPGREWMTCIGRIAFPIFAFELAQGYIHTRDLRGYAKRLALLRSPGGGAVCHLPVYAHRAGVPCGPVRDPAGVLRPAGPAAALALQRPVRPQKQAPAIRRLRVLPRTPAGAGHTVYGKVEL